MTDAVADTYSIDEDTVLNDDVSANDTYSNDATYVFNGDTDNGGTVVMNSDGSFDYTPAPDFAGEETFTYTVTDVNNTTETVSVTITVTATPDAIDDSVTTDEDTLVSGNFTILFFFNLFINFL